MIEVELKFEITKDQIRTVVDTLLLNNGKVTCERSLETSTMYDNNEEIMQHKDGRLRVRTLSGGKGEFCYKKPISRDKIKKEIEYEICKLSDDEIDTLKNILNEMGFSKVSNYERYITTIMIGDIKVTIQEFPFSNFIEIEGAEIKIKRVAKMCGLDIKNNLTKSCDTLFREWRIERGLVPTPYMHFRDFSK